MNVDYFGAQFAQILAATSGAATLSLCLVLALLVLERSCQTPGLTAAILLQRDPLAAAYQPVARVRFSAGLSASLPARAPPTFLSRRRRITPSGFPRL